MSNVRDVLGATQAVKNLLAKFAVIHDTSLDMRSKSTQRCYRRLRSLRKTQKRETPQKTQKTRVSRPPEALHFVPTMELRYSK